MSIEVARHFHLRGATGQIRTAKFHGRDHIVVPVVALVEGVIYPINAASPELVLAQEFSKAPHAWNNRPVFPNHPAENGRQVSGNTPKQLEAGAFGHVFNPTIQGKRLCMEAWLDPERAAAVGDHAKNVIRRAQSGEPIEVSVGVFVVAEHKKGSYNGKPYQAIWHDLVPDHLAMLPVGTLGACSNEMGCGVRAAEEHPVIHVISHDGQIRAAEESELETAEDSGHPFHGNQYTTDGSTERDDLKSNFAASLSQAEKMTEEEMSKNPARTAMVIIEGAVENPDKASALFDKASRAFNSMPEHTPKLEKAKVEALKNFRFALTRERERIEYSAPKRWEKVQSKLKGAESHLMADESRSLRERFAALNPFRTAKGEYSKDVMRRLYEAILEKEPALNYVEDYDDDTVIYCVNTRPSSVGSYDAPVQVASEYYTRSYTMDKDGAVTVGDRQDEVEPVMRWEPTTAIGNGNNQYTQSNGVLPSSHPDYRGPHDRILSDIESVVGAKFSREATKTIGAQTSYLKRVPGGASKRADIEHKLVNEAGLTKHAGRSKNEDLYGNKNVNISVKVQGKDLLVEAIVPNGKQRNAEEHELVDAAGARHNKSDMDLVQSMHDKSVALGAACQEPKTLADRFAAAFENADHYRTLLAGVEITDLRTAAEKEEHPFTYCMETVIPAIEAKHGQMDDPNAFCGWWKAEQKNAAAHETRSLRAACSCGGNNSHEGDENMKTKAEKIKSLIDNPKSGFTADDVKVLEGFSEERLETLAATAQKAADELKAAQDATAKAEADKKAAEDLKAAAEKSEAEIKAAAAKPKSEEELLAQYPSIKTLVDNARATEAAKKTALVTTLKAAQTVYSEERLNAMGVEQLEEIAQLTKAAAPVDQSGRGAPRALAADDPNKIPPPPDLNARIRTAAGKEPVTKH